MTPTQRLSFLIRAGICQIVGRVVEYGIVIPGEWFTRAVLATCFFITTTIHAMTAQPCRFHRWLCRRILPEYQPRD